jgi:hypothetical protein
MFGADQITRRPARAAALAAAMVAAVAGLALLLASVGSATAASAPAHASQAPASPSCKPEHARPAVRKSGNTIVASGGFYSCMGSPYAHMTLQRLRWYGWQDMVWRNGNFPADRTFSVPYNCSGTGTYTYRTWMNGRTVGGDPWYKGSRELRVAC